MTFVGTSTNIHKSKKGRIAIRYLFCLFIAFMLWLMKSLSQQHEETLFVRLEYELAQNKINVNKLPAQAELKVVSTGWQLLKEQFRIRSLRINLAAYSEEDQLITNTHKNLFSANLPPLIKVTHIYPDTLNLRIENKLVTKIPVKIKFRGIKENNWEIDSLYFYPDSITVTGPETLVKPIKYWPTEAVTLFDIDSNLRGVTFLQTNVRGNISLSATAVEYGIRVFKYIPQTYTFLLPDPKNEEKNITVTMNCQVASGKIAQTDTSDFKIVLLPISRKGTYAVKCEQFPDWVQNINLQPTFITLTSKQ